MNTGTMSQCLVQNTSTGVSLEGQDDVFMESAPISPFPLSSTCTATESQPLANEPTD